MASSLMASQALTLRNHSSLSFRNPTTLHLPPPPKHLILKPTNLTLKKSKISSSSTIPTNPNPTHFPLTDSTRTITTLLAITLSLSKTLANEISHLALKFKAIISTPPTPNDLSAIKGLQQSLVCSVGPLFFAAMKDQSSGYLNTPLTVVAAGMAKWLDIYSGVLMVRVLLSWFPNIPWDRQPLSAIRDLCDPYLNLFRNIIPPIFDTLDVSPLLAFAVLGTLGSILNSSRGAY